MIGTALVQQHLRQILGNLGANVMGGETYLGGFNVELIDPSGDISVEATRIFLQAFLDRLTSFVGRLATPQISEAARPAPARPRRLLQCRA